MKVLCLIMMLWAFPLAAQMCPGGGTNFNSVVSFDPGWIYGCNTGTSCNGGVGFDNRLACQPTTSLDACAPAPSCGTRSGDASNVWFKFFPIDSVAILSCFQNTSLVIGIQAFAGGPTCDSLDELGCDVSGGPSGGVQLSLRHLLPGTAYYFRVFGSSARSSQRTGVYCFCGSVGLGGYILSSRLSGFQGYRTGGGVNLEWTTPALEPADRFEVERSRDGQVFEKAGSVPGMQTPELEHRYHFSDGTSGAGVNFYRIREVGTQGATYFSPVITVSKEAADIGVVARPASHTLQLTVPQPAVISLYDMAGIKVRTFHVTAGINIIGTAGLSPGIYILAGSRWPAVKRVMITQ